MLDNRMQLEPARRRRVRRHTLLFTLIVLVGLLSAPVFIRHGMIYPQETTWSFHWPKKVQKAPAAKPLAAKPTR